jgi:prophage DNA circulation protein
LGNLNTNVSASMTVTADTITNGVWTNYFIVADSTGAASASTVQLLYIGVTPPVLLNIALTNQNQVVLSWPSSAGNYGLQATTNLVSATNWAALVNTLATNGNTISVMLPVTKTNEFFRLKSQ